MDRYPWAPARKGGNRAAGCKSYHCVLPLPRQRPTLPCVGTRVGATQAEACTPPSSSPHVPPSWPTPGAEGQKVTWPSRRETAVTTAMVFIMTAVTAVFFLFADQIMRMVVTLVLSVGGG